MLSYQTPARLIRENEIGAAHLAKRAKERGTGINAKGAEPDLSTAQAADFAAALARRKRG